MRRRSTGTARPRRVSVSTSSSTRISPVSGASSPAMRLTSVVLPLPERPKSAVMPGVGASNLASRENSGRRRITETYSMSALAAEQDAHAPYQQLCREEPEQPERERQDRKPQRQHVAVRGLHGGVKGERQGARHARDVRRKSDHGPELAEPRGEGRDRARQ